MESTSSPERRDHEGSHTDVTDRLAELERRVAGLEAGATGTADATGTSTGAASASSGAGHVDGSAGDAAHAANRTADANHAISGDTTGSTALPGDADTFWALHGLVNHLGDGVTYAGHTTPPGAESPVSWQMGMSSEGLHDIDFAEAAGPLAALGHPVRLQLLQSIYEGTTTVAELGEDERFGTTGQIYHHVHALASAGWLENARRGHWRVPAQQIIPLLTLVLIGTH